ncbi:MAG TPA: glycosyltransferase family 4 protein [Candidatus Saccharimonadales bacterium]|nr:glycosyltransferase family 4 protein [Candidatus Saccharimonadales bacterium]
MKIIFVSDAIYPYNKGGKEKKIFEISTRLAEKGHDVHIYTMKWWKEDMRIIKENGVYLHAMSPLYQLYSGKRRSFKEAIFFAFHCFSLLKESFDVMDVDHMPHLVVLSLKIVCLLKRKKLIVSWNEVWGKEYWRKYIGRLGLPAYYIEKLSIALPDRIISISELTTEKIKNEFNRIHEVYTVDMGINYKEIELVRPSKEKSDVIFAGRLLDNKNVDVLIKAIAHVKKSYPAIQCTIIGEGPERESLEKLIQNFGLEKNIKIIDFLPEQHQLYSFFKSSKIFAFPSTREGFGIVVLEANACGLPVIVINHKDNASKNLIKKDNGKIISLDENMLSTAIIELLQTKINKAGIMNAVKKYDWDIIANTTLEVYKK